MDAPSVFDRSAQHDDVDSKVIAAIERIGETLRALLRAEARAQGVSPIQAQILVFLASRDSRTRVGELAAEFGVTAATVSDALGSLEKKKLACRKSDPEDARALRVVPTAKGRRVAARLESWADPVRDLLPGETDAGNKEVTLGVLLELIASLDRGGLLSRARVCPSCRFFRPEVHRSRTNPHHCALLDAPLGPATLRLDCPEHEPPA